MFTDLGIDQLWTYALVGFSKKYLFNFLVLWNKNKIKKNKMEKWALLKFLKNHENNSLCFYKCFDELGYHKGRLKIFK